MIQIGHLKTWFTKEGEKKVFFKVVKGVSFKNLNDLFKNVKEKINTLPEEEKANLFYTVAHHLEGKRTFKSWQGQDIIPFDLDGIDLNQIDRYPKIAAEALGVDLKKCGVNYTGNGIHLLVKVKLWRDKDFIKDSKSGYRALYDRIVKACEEEKLPITKDTTAWDYARILRVPFTKNIKIKDGKEVIKNCTLVNGDMQEQELQIPLIEKPRDEFFMTKGSYPKADKKEILKECHFFKWLKDNPDEVHEPQAYAMLSITGNFDDENKTSAEYWNKFSSPSINSKDLAEFTEQALTASGPRTCLGINEVYGKCKLCPHYNKITSPILLRDKDFIGTEHCGFTLIGARGTKVRQYEDLVKFFIREKKYLYLADIGTIYVYEEGYYRPVEDAYIKNYAMRFFTGPTKASERLEFLRYCEDFNYSSLADLDDSKHDGLINFKNGVYDLKTKKLLDHSHEYKFLYCLPYDYNPNAKSPVWDKFISEVTLERKDLINILEEYIGYCLRGGEYNHHKALILSGDGKNGKSTFNDILKELVGHNNIASTSLTSMAANPFSLATLQGKLVNVSEEEPVSCFKETGVFKNITGNNLVQAQQKFKNPFQMVNKAKVIITYNEMPYIADTSTGMKRRLMIVPFDLDLEYGAKKADINLVKKMKAELSGIANRALEGYERLEARGEFTHSSIIDDEVREVMEDNNPFYAWYDECIDSTDNDNDFISIQDIYNNYIEFMEDNNRARKPLGKTKLSLMLKRKGFKKEIRKINGKTPRGFSGIKLVGARF